MGERDGRERLGCDKKGRKERERAVSVRPSVRPSPPHNRPTGAFMHSARGLSGLGHNLGRLWRGRRRAADFHSEMAAPSVGNPMWSSSQAIAAAERREGERSCIRRRGEPCSSGLETADSLFSGGRAGGRGDSVTSLESFPRPTCESCLGHWRSRSSPRSSVPSCPIPSCISDPRLFFQWPSLRIPMSLVWFESTRESPKGTWGVSLPPPLDRRKPLWTWPPRPTTMPEGAVLSQT